MVKMAVCVYEFNRFELVCFNEFFKPLLFAVGITARVNNYALLRFVPQYIAAFAQVVKIKCLYLYHSINLIQLIFRSSQHRNKFKLSMFSGAELFLPHSLHNKHCLSLYSNRNNKLSSYCKLLK